MRGVTTRRRYLQTVGAGATGIATLPGARACRGRPRTLTLAGSMSLTGEYATLGRLYRDAYRLTVTRINAAGGVEAGDGNTYRLQLRLQNDESDPAKSRAIYERLVDRQGVDYLLGPYSSSITLAASQVAEDRHRPMVQGSGASPEIFESCPEWLFGLLPTADTYATSTVEMAAAQDEPPNSAALLTEDDTFSQSSATGARQALDDAGIQVAVDESFPSETTDLTDLVRQVGDAGAELLILSAHERHAVLLANTLAAESVAPKLVMATVGSLTASFREQTGANADYVCGSSPWNDTARFDDPVYGSTDEFIAAIQRRFRYDPDYHSAAAAAAVETFQYAFQRVDDLTPTAVRDAIRESAFTTAYGDIAFDARGVLERDSVVYQWQPTAGGADALLVWPGSDREAPLIYPMPDWANR